MDLELLPREKLETIKKFLHARKIITSRENFNYFVTQTLFIAKEPLKRSGATISWSLTSLIESQTVRLNDSS